ncbi:MAG TPA: glycosyl hydrolase family 28-related protein, partial [Polyangiaceae bacterium]
ELPAARGAGTSGTTNGGSAGRAGSAGAPNEAGAGGEPSAGPSAGEGGAGDAAGAAGGGDSPEPDELFRPSTRFTVINPKDYGALGDGVTDDAAALESAFAAVPAAGGIVLFPAGTYLKERRLVRVTQSHTLLWAPNRRATIHGTVRTLTDEERAADLCGVRQQAIVFRQTTGGGVYGLRFGSDAVERTSCAEDCQITLDTVNGFEVVGTEVEGAPACGVFAWSSRSGERSENLFVEGNYIHHTYADSVHHTHGARRSWCWGNYFFNEVPSLGDDGIACVTYSPSDPRCGEMEWWGNFYLGGMHGRGMAVIGGEDIAIHHNWIVGSASAGLIVASESSYTSASSERIELRSNWIVDSPNGSVNNGHSSILISGGNPEAEPIREVEAVDNVIVGAPGGRVERAEGDYDAESVVFDNSTDPGDLPGPVPTLEEVAIRDTSILRTRDVSFVTEAERRGLYRIHVREAAEGVEERFEYVVSGAESELSGWLDARREAGAYLSETRSVAGAAYALVLSPVPLEVPAELDAVSFEALRAGDRDGSLAWLWSRLDAGDY